jgi:hypothetical protein
MTKHIGLFIFFSILAAVFLHELHYVLSLISLTYSALYRMMGWVFSADRLGMILRQSVVFILVPVVVAFVPSLIHKLIKKTWLSQHYFILTMWVSWVVLITLLAR